MMDTWLLDILACPTCGATPLSLAPGPASPDAAAEDWLACPAGEHLFPILDGIPRLLPQGLTPGLTVSDPRWQVWRDKLQVFVAWRRMNTARAAAKPGHVDPALDELQRRFRAFYDLDGTPDGGLLLDVGCAAGAARGLLGPGWTYVGVDPLPIVAAPTFPLIQAMGECLPFRDEAFAAVLVMQTLDHAADPGLLVRQLHRVLRPGGALLVQQAVDRVRPRRRPVPARWLHALLLGRTVAADATKTHDLSECALRSLLEPGFRIDASERVPPHHVFLRATAVS